MRTVVKEPASPSERHVAAVRSSLERAQASADRGDHADALEWIGVLEAIGEQIPPGYQAKRQAWAALLDASRAGRGRS